MQTVVLGGFGNFGARICRALTTYPGIKVVAAGRNPPVSATDTRMSAARLDMRSPGFASVLAALQPDLVIHCAGPFQGQDYRVVQAALAAGAHYIDLADGRDFVVRFAESNYRAAQTAGRLAVSGASTLPALSSAVIDHLQLHLQSVDEIQIAIAPGQKAPRGEATFAAVLTYAGKPFRWLSRGNWRTVWGWQELKRVRLAFGERWAAACDVPDLQLLPQRYPGVQTVEFRAALEVPVQHYFMWALAGMRRRGIELPVERWAGPLNRAAALLDVFGSECGGMMVSVAGRAAHGSRKCMTWQLTAEANHGPEIPCMAALLLARKLVAGQVAMRGAYPCMGFLKLGEFEPEFARWGITTSVEEAVA